MSGVTFSRRKDRTFIAEVVFGYFIYQVGLWKEDAKDDRLTTRRLTSKGNICRFFQIGKCAFTNID